MEKKTTTLTKMIRLDSVFLYRQGSRKLWRPSPFRYTSADVQDQMVRIDLLLVERHGLTAPVSDILVTPTKPAHGGITDFDVKFGAYILQYDDVQEYRDAVACFNSTKASLPAKALRRHSRPVNSTLSDITNAKRSEVEETALDRLLREADSRAELPSKTTPLQGLRARGDSIQQWVKPREAKIPDAHETRNFHQMPLAARGFVAEDAHPMTLLRIGFLPGQSREIGEVAHILDNSIAPTSRRGLFSSKDADDAAGYIDILEEAYEPFGTDVNYVSPSWMKTFTRRLSRWKGHLDEEFTLLSPWQGTCVFVPSRARNTVKCYHTFSTSPSERVLVSELRLNIFTPAASLPRRGHQTRASSDSDDSSTVGSPTRLKRNSGSFPTYKRSRGVSESSSYGTTSIGQSAAAAIHDDLPVLMVPRKPLTHESSPVNTPPLPARPARQRASSNATTESDRSNKRGINFSALRQRMTSDEKKADGHERADGPLAKATAAFERMDLSLGQERLGGGLRGRDAKLAKVVIYAPGQQFLDLLVAANLLLFNRAWQLTKHA
ncbi:hypothetical protein FH972_026197 [Carpinus fangiana]|uniref:Uncharacterized protein n=1 Tax=Carpinus fangiana TaxID=176857 RepID=A0A5N6L391_9ROSI|nr:hypothetical protein FH972_026197 [Carpinus fangiana]